MVTEKMRKHANRIARGSGYGRATRIVVGRKDSVISRIDSGYVKDSDGSYVSNAYRQNFGWKNTHYQSAETVVEIDARKFSDVDMMVEILELR